MKKQEENQTKQNETIKNDEQNEFRQDNTKNKHDKNNNIKNDNKNNNNNNNKQDLNNKNEIVTKKEYDELKETLQRVHAEFQNYLKRTEDDKSKFIKLSNETLIKNLLPIIDNLELALIHNKEKNEFSEGITLILQQFLQILEKEGLQKIPAIGKFDPNKHEAIMIEQSEESGTIIQELQKGYMLNDKILRSSKVKISKKTNQGGNKNE